MMALDELAGSRHSALGMGADEARRSVPNWRSRHIPQSARREAEPTLERERADTRGGL